MDCGDNNHSTQTYTLDQRFYIILSYPILSYPILSYPILLDSILSYPFLFYFIIFNSILSYIIGYATRGHHTYPIVSYCIVSCLILTTLPNLLSTCPMLSYPSPSNPILFWPILSYLIISYYIVPIIPHLIPYYSDLSYHIISYYIVPILSYLYFLILSYLILSYRIPCILRYGVTVFYGNREVHNYFWLYATLISQIYITVLMLLSCLRLSHHLW